MKRVFELRKKRYPDSKRFAELIQTPTTRAGKSRINRQYKTSWVNTCSNLVDPTSILTPSAELIKARPLVSLKKIFLMKVVQSRNICSNRTSKNILPLDGRKPIILWMYLGSSARSQWKCENFNCFLMTNWNYLDTANLQPVLEWEFDKKNLSKGFLGSYWCSKESQRQAFESMLDTLIITF